MEVSLKTKALKFLEEHYRNHFTENQSFHSLDHAKKVCKAAEDIAKIEGLSEERIKWLALAALFHDSGYYLGSDGHEKKSGEIARNFLESEGVESANVQTVVDCILATLPSSNPETIEQKIIKDADLAHLGSKNYFIHLAQLRSEWRIGGNSFKDLGWWNMNVEFLRTHRYYTESANKLYGEQKKHNLENIAAIAAESISNQESKKKKKALKAKQPKAPKTPKPKKVPKPKTIMDSRPAQMMFKTSLRNHIDLTNIADNKANMMLSINALIVTITIPLVANINTLSLSFMIPISFLLLTSIVSIVYAALVTRPIKMDGMTYIDAINEGKSNLFFFGNFYKMGLNQYEDGMKAVLENEHHLNNAILRDLYFLGKALGGKYKKLRICYMVFIVGMVLTVLSFIVSLVV